MMMKIRYSKNILEQLLENTSVKLDGPNPWDPQIQNEEFYQRVLKGYELGLGEAYMDGWWDCPRLDEFFFMVLRAGLDDEHLLAAALKNKAIFSLGANWVFNKLRYSLFNYQTQTRSYQVAETHYNISNELFSYMLDPELNYSCAYWKDCDNLNQAQLAKLKLICDKLRLAPGEKVLDIGCGWGSFARYAAKNYGVSILGITVSKQQKELAEKMSSGLPIEIRLQDYRQLNEKFDKVVSIGMFEHVGYKNYATFMKVAHHCLKDDGLFLLHTIGSNTSVTRANLWINKYIFPNGMIPSIKQIGQSYEKYFVMEDWHNFGSDYDKTLMAWYENFNHHWDILKETHNERFKRMWDYYLLSSAGAFRARFLQLWQVVLSKKGLLGGYQTVR